MTAPRCQRRHCGLLLVRSVDAIGRVHFACPGCARNAQGRCRDCPRRLASAKALRCPACIRAQNARVNRAGAKRWSKANPERRAAKNRRYYDRHREELCAKAREAYTGQKLSVLRRSRSNRGNRRTAA